jgi:hypothetical protein
MQKNTAWKSSLYADDGKSGLNISPAATYGS